MNSLSHVHIITDTDSTSSRGNHGTSFQSLADKAITCFYFDFSASWPRTPSWISFLGSDTFYSNFARIFKRLIQECGMPVLLALKDTLKDFSNAKEKSKQCVAAEVLAGVLHSDVSGLLGAWDSWIMIQLQKVIFSPSVESIPEWAACIRYAVTGKGKYGTRVPLLRQRIMECLVTPLPQTVATSVVAKCYTFLSAILIEISPPRMPITEVQFHVKLLEELLGNMSHSSAQVRKAIGVALSVVCSNIWLYESFPHNHLREGGISNVDDPLKVGSWVELLRTQPSELVLKWTLPSWSDDSPSTDEVRWMETMFHFIISSLKSGRSSCLLDIIVGAIYPVLYLQETSNKDLSALAKVAFEFLHWRILPEPHLQTAVSKFLDSTDCFYWQTVCAVMTYLGTFMYRHKFILSKVEKQEIWNIVECLLINNQVEIGEHAAAVLAGMMKGEDEDLAKDFRDRAYTWALSIQKMPKQMFFNDHERLGGTLLSVAQKHGAILALTASILSVPYDMPSWLPDHVTLLARFVGEPSPVGSTAMKTVAEFRQTHADTWNIQKDSFSEEQLELTCGFDSISMLFSSGGSIVLADTPSSSSYFA